VCLADLAVGWACLVTAAGGVVYGVALQLLRRGDRDRLVRPLFARRLHALLNIICYPQAYHIPSTPILRPVPRTLPPHPSSATPSPSRSLPVLRPSHQGEHEQGKAISAMRQAEIHELEVRYDASHFESCVQRQLSLHTFLFYCPDIVLSPSHVPPSSLLSLSPYPG